MGGHNAAGTSKNAKLGLTKQRATPGISGATETLQNNMEPESFDTGGAAMEMMSPIGEKVKTPMEAMNETPVSEEEKLKNTQVGAKIKANGLRDDNINGVDEKMTLGLRQKKAEVDEGMKGYKSSLDMMRKMKRGKKEIDKDSILQQRAVNQEAINKAKDLVKLSSEDLKAKGENASAEDLLRHRIFVGNLENMQYPEEKLYHDMASDYPDEAKDMFNVEDGSMFSEYLDAQSIHNSDGDDSTIAADFQDDNKKFTQTQAAKGKQIITQSPEHFTNAEMGASINATSDNLKGDTDLLREALGLGESTGFCDSEAAKYAYKDQPVIERLMRLTDQKVSDRAVFNIIASKLDDSDSDVHKILANVEKHKARYAKDYGVTEAELAGLVAYTGPFYAGMKSVLNGLGKGLRQYCAATTPEDKRRLAAEMFVSLTKEADENDEISLHKRESLVLCGLAMRALAKVMAVRKAPPMKLGTASKTPKEAKEWQTAFEKGENAVDYAFLSSARYDSRYGDRSSKPVHTRISTDRYVDVSDVSIYPQEDECLSIPGLEFGIDYVDPGLVSKGTGVAALRQRGLEKDEVTENKPGDDPRDFGCSVFKRIKKISNLTTDNWSS